MLSARRAGTGGFQQVKWEKWFFNWPGSAKDYTVASNDHNQVTSKGVKSVFP